MESKSFSVCVSQIITKNLIITGQYEVITDEGFLRSPYRSVRFFIDPFTPGPPGRDLSEHALEQRRVGPREVLPALSRRHRRHVPLLHRHLGRHRPHRRARLRASARQATGAATGSSKAACVTTRRPSRRLLPGHLPARRLRATSWRATRSSRPTTPSPPASSATYEFKIERFPWLSKGQLNLRYDYMTVNYDDFRDARFSLGSFGSLPARAARARAPSRCTSSNANIIQFYISAFF